MADYNLNGSGNCAAVCPTNKKPEVCEIFWCHDSTHINFNKPAVKLAAMQHNFV